MLENELVRMELCPARGGRATRLLFKPAQKELVHLASTSAAPQGVGLLLDIHRGIWELPYEWEAVEETDSRVAVRLSRTVTIGRQRKIKIRLRKTIDVQKGRSSVLVSYELSNAGDENALLSFRLTNVFSPGGAEAPARHVSFPYGVLAEKRAVNVSPSLARRHDLTYYLKSEASVNHWVMEPSQSWIGVRDPSGLGVGMEVDFPHVDVLYSWFPSTQAGTGFPTAEVFYRPVELRPFKADPDEVVFDPSLRGNVFRQTVRLVPFANLPRFDGCRNGVVAGIDADGATARIHCVAERDLKGTVALFLREPADTDAREAGRAPLDLVVGKESTTTVKLSETASGRVVIARLLDAAGEAVAEFERPVGNAAWERYVQLPQAERAPRALGTRPEWRPDEWEPTPHTKWAKPYHQGPIKILCVVSGRGTGDVLELSQRIDAEIDYMPVAHPHVFAEVFEMGKVADPNATFPLLLDGKRKYDVILLASGLHWDGLPERMRELILDRVREGTGLVYVRGFGWAKKFDAISKEPPDDPTLESALWRTLPVQCVPANARWRKPIEKLVRFAKLGKGRVVQCLWNVWIGYKPYKAEGLVPHPIEETDIPTFRYWEYAHAAIAKMLYYAAGRDPNVRILSITHTDLGKATLTLKAQKGADLVAEVGVYDRFHRELALVKQPVTVKSGPWRLAIDLPAIEGDGEHPVEVRLLRDGKVVDWAALVVPIQAPLSIADASFAKRLYAPREAPVLRLGLRNTTDGDHLAEVRVRIVDSWGRCVREHAAPVQIPPTAGDRTHTKELTLPSFLPVTPYHRAEIKLVAGGHVRSERHVPFSVALPLPFDYNFLCWSGYAISSHYTDRRHVQLVRSIGYDIYSMNQHGENYQPYSMPAFEKGYETVTRAGLRPLAQSVSPVRTHWRSKEPPKVRPEPLCSEEYREKAAHYIERSCIAAERFYLHALSSGDEPSLGWYDRAQDFDHSPQTLERLREHLKKTYRGLDRLNATWKKDFKSWDEVVPDTFAEARARNHFASWADHRLYMEIELTDFLEFFAHEVKTASGGAPMALSGMGFGGVFNGFDFSRLMPLLDRSTLYGDGDGEFAKPEIQRSFQRKGALNGVWIGYGNTEEFLRSWIWLQALSDKFLVSVYSSTYQVRCERYLTERGRFYQRLFKEYRESGTGTVLRSAERVEDPIAILYSKPSIMAAAVTGLTDRQYTVLALRHNRDAWTRVVHDTGFNCRFVSNWQVADGILARDGYRVLILPLAQSMSRAETENVAQFVKGGGLLIADVRSAILDEHCVPYDGSPLDDVLGLDRTQAQAAPVGNAIEIAAGKPCRASKFRGTTLERDIRAKGAAALGRGVLSMKGRDGTYGTLKIESTRDVSRSTAEAIFLHRYGKGAAVYCNFMLDNYREKLSNGTAHEVYRVFADLIRNVASLKPRAEVLGNGELLPDCHTVCYRNGDTRLVALQRHTYSYRYPRLTEDRREPVTVRLPGAGQVYEVWSRRFLGAEDEVQDTLEPGARRLYVVLPYRTAEMRVKGPSSATPGSGLTLEAEIATDGAPAQEHVFRVTVTRPDGKETEHHAQNLVAAVGRTSLVLPIALDAPTGRWSAQVRDILTGVAATHAFQVSHRRP